MRKVLRTQGTQRIQTVLKRRKVVSLEQLQGEQMAQKNVSLKALIVVVVEKERKTVTKIKTKF